MDNIRAFGPLGIAIGTIIFSLIAQWSVFGVRLMAVESSTIQLKIENVSLQTQLSDQKANYAKLDAKIDAISENVSYIRTRLDTIK